jgi:hypothetical protein
MEERSFHTRVGLTIPSFLSKHRRFLSTDPRLPAECAGKTGRENVEMKQGAVWLHATDRADVCAPFPLWCLRIYRHKASYLGKPLQKGCNREGVLTACDADITDLSSASRTRHVSRKQSRFV